MNVAIALEVCGWLMQQGKKGLLAKEQLRLNVVNPVAELPVYCLF